MVYQTVSNFQECFLHNPSIFVSLSLYRNRFVFVLFGKVSNQNPIFLFCINPYQFQIFGNLWKITERFLMDLPYQMFLLVFTKKLNPQ